MKIIKNKNHVVRIALLALILGLTGCNKDKPSQATPLSVTPSLGFVRQADVRVLDLAGHELASGSMDDSGTFTLPNGVTGGFIVELHGNDKATYYDEGVRAWRALPAGTVLHAACSSGRDTVAVSALTEIAYQRAQELANGSALNKSVIDKANDEVSTWLARVPERIEADGTQVMPAGTPDILAPAQQVKGGEHLHSDTAEGRYAILLASLAQQAYVGAVKNNDACAEDARCSPVLPLIVDLATDFADGVLDDKNPNGTSMGLPFIDPDVHPGNVFHEASTSSVDNDLTPQQEIGHEFPGTYALVCTGDSQPTQMVIHDNGAIGLAGPQGNYWLPFDDVTVKSPLVEHSYRITPTGKAFTARLEHLEYGEPYYSVVKDLEINAHVDGTVQLVKGDVIVNCHTDFTHGNLQPAIPYFTDILVGADFICTHTGGGPLTLGTLSFGPGSFLRDGVLQPVRHSEISEYKHVMYKTAYPADTVHTYEYYEWGQPFMANYLSLSRAMLRYQGYPFMNTFDMQSTNNMQGMTNCSHDGPALSPELFQSDSIVMDFGATQLSL